MSPYLNLDELWKGKAGMKRSLSGQIFVLLGNKVYLLLETLIYNFCQDYINILFGIG
jgi:hypothetical protein